MNPARSSSTAIRILAWVLIALTVPGCSSGRAAHPSPDVPVSAAIQPAPVKLRLMDTRTVTLHDWTFEADTLRGTRDAWVEGVRVRKTEAIALNDVVHREGGTEGEDLREYLAAKQATVVTAREQAAASPWSTQSPPAASLDSLARQGGVPGAVSAGSGGQPAAPSVPVARVRIRLNDSPQTWIHGTIVRSSPESLWIRGLGWGDTDQAIERAEISQLQVFDGRTSAAGTGVLVGAVAGLAFTGGVALAYGAEVEDEDAGAVLAVAALFGAAGAVLGGLVGLMIRKDKWVDNPLPRVSLEGSKDGIRMSVGVGPPPTGGQR